MIKVCARQDKGHKTHVVFLSQQKERSFDKIRNRSLLCCPKSINRRQAWVGGGGWVHQSDGSGVIISIYKQLLFVMRPLSSPLQRLTLGPHHETAVAFTESSSVSAGGGILR